jgi:hypothetical protein
MPQFAARGDPGLRRSPLRSLYREVAKRVHPDLTLDEADRGLRQRLMAEANEAFEQGDATRLVRLLELSRLKPEHAPSGERDSDLVRAIRKITLKTRLHFTFLDRFNKEPMRAARSLLAEELLKTSPPQFIPQDLPEFFEEMNMFMRDCYLDGYLLWTTFGFSAIRWWAACNRCVNNERSLKKDPALFSGFQDLAAFFARRDQEAGLAPPGKAEVKAFLEIEIYGAGPEEL